MVIIKKEESMSRKSRIAMFSELKPEEMFVILDEQISPADGGELYRKNPDNTLQAIYTDADGSFRGFGQSFGLHQDFLVARANSWRMESTIVEDPELTRPMPKVHES